MRRVDLPKHPLDLVPLGVTALAFAFPAAYPLRARGSVLSPPQHVPISVRTVVGLLIGVIVGAVFHQAAITLLVAGRRRTLAWVHTGVIALSAVLANAWLGGVTATLIGLEFQPWFFIPPAVSLVVLGALLGTGSFLRERWRMRTFARLVLAAGAITLAAFCIREALTLDYRYL